jgi:hypothetical protein
MNIADAFGAPAAYVSLAFVGLVAVLRAAGAMPETRPSALTPSRD